MEKLPPSEESSAIHSRTSAGSRPVLSNRSRSRLEEIRMSMLGDMVWKKARWV